jgi:hypothetical protein
MPIIKIDNVEYETDTLSGEAKAQLISLQFCDQELARLQAKAAAYQTARLAYAKALKEALSIEKIRQNLLMSIEDGQYHAREKIKKLGDLSYDNYLSVGLALKECFLNPQRHDELIQRLTPHTDVIIGVLPPGLQSYGLLPKRAELNSEQIEEKQLADITDADIRQWIIDDGSLVYGELERQDLHNYFAAVAPFLSPGGRFVDLGSGLGKVVISAALHYPFESCKGIELLGYRHKLAQERLQKVLDTVAADLQEVNLPVNGSDPIQLPWGDQLKVKDISQLQKRVELFEGDMFDFDVSQASLIFIYSTCFGSLMTKISHKLANEAPVGCLVSTTTFSITHPAFELVLHFPAKQMAWTDVFIYRLIGDQHWPEIPPTVSLRANSTEWEVKARALLSQNNS